MKKSLFFILYLLLSFSCEKESQITENKIPGWLKEQIYKDEQIIKTEPKLMQNYGAWIRYEFNNDVYFEYDNLLSSLSRNPYSWEGIRINTTVSPYTNYWNDKCCEKIIWQAPNYQALKYK